jgi:hypothetical protein
MLRPRVLIQVIAGLILSTAVPLVAQMPPDAAFNPLPPCRVVDSRSNLGTSGILLPGQIRNITFRGKCGLPGLTGDGGLESNAVVAVAMNVVAANPAGAGHLSAWPSNREQPASSILNYATANVANGIILPMCDQLNVAVSVCAGGDIKFQSAVSPTDLVIDVTGYYLKPTLPGARRHGIGAGADTVLCLGSDNHFGLSDKLVSFADAPLACPAGTHVCPEAVVIGNHCDTSRADSACDYRDCEGTCIDQPPTNHFGWASADNSTQALARVVGEDVGFAIFVPTCQYRPVWCCSGP